MGTLIEFDEVSFEYVDRHGAVVGALRDVSLSVDEGEFVAVIGHNGSGKSTLAKHMNALLTPTSGTVNIRGMDSRSASDLWEIRRLVGFVFQNPDNQIVASTVEEDVAFGPENLGLPSVEIDRRITGALESVGMGAFRLRAPHHLSGGQKQRVAIAGVLAMEPACIVLDEPTAMLDPVGRASVFSALADLRAKMGTSILVVTHHMDEAALADRVVVMEAGRIVLDGSPASVFAQESTLRRIGLDVPAVTEVAWLLRSRGFAVPAGVIREGELVDALCPLSSRT